MFRPGSGQAAMKLPRSDTLLSFLLSVVLESDEIAMFRLSSAQALKKAVSR